MKPRRYTLKPRHYVLIAVLIAVSVFDYVRIHRHSPTVASGAGVTTVTVAPSVPTTPSAQLAWTAFDKAASQRDANDHDFQTALDQLNATKGKVLNAPGSYDAQDLETCRMWLLQYRKAGSMHALAAEHVDSCAKLHRDVAY